MDHLYNIKSHLEDADLKRVLEYFKLEEDILNISFSNYNYCICSNKSFVFIYLEQVAAFLALNLNKLSNCHENNNFINSFQVFNYKFTKNFALILNFLQFKRDSTSMHRP